MEEEGGRWAFGIIGVWHEAGVDPALQFDTGLSESRLSDCVVFAQEIELYLVARGCPQCVRDVHLTGGASNCYLEGTG